LSSGTLRLPGVLDSDIWKIYNLQRFYVSNNNLIGSIPDRFDPCLHLSILDLSNNLFSGSIPVAISKCEELVALDLKNNNLSGSIPTELAVM
jgi:Leucine-rich repeat (LRR) protein